MHFYMGCLAESTSGCDMVLQLIVRACATPSFCWELPEVTDLYPGMTLSTSQAYFPCTTSHAFLPTLTQWWLSADVFQVGHLQKMILLFWSNPSLPWRHSQRRPVSSSPGLYACVFWGGIKRGGKDCHISARSPQLQTTFRTLLWFSKTR